MSLDWKRYFRFENEEHAKLFRRLFVSISIALLIVWQVSLYFDALLANGEDRGAVHEATHHARDLLAKTLDTFAADIQIVAKGQNLRDLVSGDAEARDETIYDFMTFVSEKPAIAQLRYIDRLGNEIVRVDRRGREVVIVDDADLQNKASRYYFQLTTGLPEGRLYISAIDLNVEHGEVEQPWNPMLRFGAPLRGTDSELLGVVIINVFAQGFIDDIQRSRPPGSQPLQLLNQEGYWLAGAPDEMLWGFMFDKDTSMAKSNPGIWEWIEKKTEGEIEGKDLYYVFSTLRPAVHLSPDGPVAAVRASDVEWKVVGTIPVVSLLGTWHYTDLLVTPIGFFIITVISFGWSRAAVQHRQVRAIQAQAEAELIRVERLASLGSLVAGVAHELNTPIGNSVTIASTLSAQGRRFGNEITQGPISRSTVDTFLRDLEEGTEIMLNGLRRASQLVHQFKQVAVDQTSEQRRRFRIDELVSDTITTVAPQFKHSPVDLETDVKSVAELDSYPGALSQILINLVINAQIHGFDEGCSGKVVVSVEDMSDGSIEIRVRDNGKGIPKDRLDKIFEPFFTTRLGEGGSGLGLSIAFNAATHVLGGSIRAESLPGQGTTVIVSIPGSAPSGTDIDLRKTYDVEYAAADT